MVRVVATAPLDFVSGRVRLSALIDFDFADFHHFSNECGGTS